MAKKKRVPAPPRPVQAPKKRVEQRDPRRTRILFIAVGIALAVAAGAVGIALAVGGGSGSDEGVAGACTRQTLEEQGRNHVEELAEDFEYNSTPATSGPHFPVPAIWNVYDQPVPEIRLVHNLEHGGVVVQYGDEVPPGTVGQIVDWYAEDPNGLIVTPRPELGNEIALTAWTHLATCSTFDEKAFSDFRDDYRGNGPERIPVESLQPGST